MKRLALAMVLVCALAGVAQAGEIHTTGAVAPQLPPQATSSIVVITLTIIDIIR